MDTEISGVVEGEAVEEVLREGEATVGVAEACPTDSEVGGAREA